MLKKVFSIVLPVFVLANVQAQDNINITNFKNETKIFAPSPNAAALGKYGEVPVSTHTGIPSIGVPIYNWKSQRSNISVNLSLSYHAGGIKVEDIAPNTGLGWSLNGAAVVSRTVRGLPDDDVWGYLNTPVLPDFNTSVYTGAYYHNPVEPSLEAITMNTSRSAVIGPFNTPTSDQQIAKSILDGRYDTEQDVFYYSVGGLSGKFVLDKDGQVQKMDQNNCRINVQYTYYTSGPVTFRYVSSFTITTDKGLIYQLDVREYTSNGTTTETTSYNYKALEGYNPSSGGIGQPPPNLINYSLDYHPNLYGGTSNSTSFYASKAIDPLNADTVYFDYIDREVLYQNGFSESVEYHDNNDPITYISTNGKLKSRSISYSFNRVAMKSLWAIRFSDHSSVSFRYGLNRADLQGDSALTRISISDYLGNKIQYQLNYAYFEADDNLAPSWSFTLVGQQEDYVPHPDHVKKRLKLVSVTQVNSSDTESFPLYQFEYNDISLPARNSKAIDFWGYYTGPERYSGTLIPQLYEIVRNPQGEGLQAPDYLWNFTAYEGADRTPVAGYCKAGLLKQITYPTGGVTNFEFEANSVKDPIYFTSYQRDIKINSPINNLSYPMPIGFEDRSQTGVNFYLSFTRVNADGTSFVPPPHNPNMPQLCLDEAVGNSTITMTVKSSDGLVEKTVSFNAVEQGTGNAWIYLNLPLGKQYSFYYTHNTYNDPCLSAYFRFETRVNYVNNNLSTLVGGVRLKSLTTTAATNAQVERIDYTYNNEDGFSSGVVPFVPNHAFRVNTVGKWSGCGENTETLPFFLGYADYKVRTSNSTQTLGYSFGSNVGYLRVEKKRVSVTGENVGKEIFTYSGPEIRNRHDVHPHQSIQQIDWASGHPLTESVYHADGTLQRKITNTYSDIVDKVTTDKNRSLKLTCIRTDNCAPPHSSLPYLRYAGFTYYPFTGYSQLVQQKTEEFTVQGSATTITDFEYDNYRNVRAIKTTDSRGRVLATEVFYPYDYSAGSPTMGQMVSANNIGQQVMTRKVLYKGTNRYQSAGDRVAYAGFDGTIKPSTFYQFRSTRPELLAGNSGSVPANFFEEKESEITKYDEFGNAVEFTGKDGVKTSVIWGYKKTRPVLKITGANYQDAVSKLSSVSLAALQAIVDPVVLRAKLNEIRQGYQQDKSVQVNSYTYQPLYGPDSETDANGRTMYYAYDGFGRLSLVRDNDQNVLKKICYNYAGQVSTCGAAIETPVCNTSTCSGPDKKCINGVCETGVKICISAIRIRPYWQISYQYKWSDNSVSPVYQEISDGPCLLPL